MKTIKEHLMETDRNVLLTMLASRYVYEPENLKKNINYVVYDAAHGERFYVRYDEYLVNRAENRLVKATLLKLQSITGSAENQKEIRQLLSAFEMVEASANYQKDFSRIVIDRNTKDYDLLIRWARVFLLTRVLRPFLGSIMPERCCSLWRKYLNRM